MIINYTKPEIFSIIRDIIVQEQDILLPKLEAEVFLNEIMDDREIDLPVIIDEIEKGFGIHITDLEMEQLETIEELVELVEEKLI